MLAYFSHSFLFARYVPGNYIGAFFKTSIEYRKNDHNAITQINIKTYRFLAKSNFQDRKEQRLTLQKFMSLKV
jgi:hypothetical protein